MICIKETNKEVVDKAMCQALWGDVEVCWEMLPANNTAGGILCLWSEINFRLQSKTIGNGFKEDWARATKEGPRVLINLRLDF